MYDKDMGWKKVLYFTKLCLGDLIKATLLLILKEETTLASQRMSLWTLGDCRLVYMYIGIQTTGLLAYGEVFCKYLHQH